MKLLYAVAELFPLLKTGGLADVSAALPAALAAAGADVRLLLPGFDAIVAGTVADGPPLPLPAGGPRLPRTSGPAPVLQPVRLAGGGGPRLYRLEAPALYHRAGGPYADATGRPWPDNALRFGLLGWAAAALGLGADPGWQPDVVHAHDWHAALAPLYLRLAAGSGARPASVFTIHNLAYQGLFAPSAMATLGLPPALFGLQGVEFYGQLSFMKAALQFADAITTVSPRYAQEILTPEQGCGLDGLLRERRAVVSGILNGVDYGLWNPDTDPHTGCAYDADRLAGKAAVKRALQTELGLSVRPDAPLFGAVTRLSEQKGLHLLLPVLAELFARGGQLVVLGSGEPEVEGALRAALAGHPHEAVLRVGYDEPLAHRIIAGADVLLMPSRYEPCGLTQLYALRYGTLPLVHAVGGLADTVTDCALEHLDDGRASGFVFTSFDAEALRAALRRAYALYRRPADWQAVQRQAMRQRFEWADAARAYLALFARLTGRPQPAAAPAPPHAD